MTDWLKIYLSTILASGLLLYCGYCIGVHSKSNKIKKRMVKLALLEQRIKQTNNQVVKNYAIMYSRNNPHPEKFTDVDALLFKMWMD